MPKFTICPISTTKPQNIPCSQGHSQLHNIMLKFTCQLYRSVEEDVHVLTNCEMNISSLNSIQLKRTNKEWKKGKHPKCSVASRSYVCTSTYPWQDSTKYCFMTWDLKPKLWYHLCHVPKYPLDVTSTRLTLLARRTGLYHTLSMYSKFNRKIRKFQYFNNWMWINSDANYSINSYEKL